MSSGAIGKNLELGKTGPKGEPVCKRAKCKRMKNLNKNGLCGGHACPVPGCLESKSSTDPLCEIHAAAKTQPLPKNWLCVTVENSVPLYLNTKLFCAQYDHPGAKGEKANPNTSKRKAEKPKKGYPTVFL
jgi:hypothetical protein